MFESGQYSVGRRRRSRRVAICEKCFSMFFDGSGNKGKCTAYGGGHVAQGFLFPPHWTTGARTV